MTPYVYVATGKSVDVRRDAPTGVRVAVHFPDIGRCVELWVDKDSRYTLQTGPDATHGGDWCKVATGDLIFGDE